MSLEPNLAPIARLLTDLLRRYPKEGLIVSVTMLATTILAGTFLDTSKVGERNKATASVTEQIQQLDTTQATLKNLGDFIQSQRQQLQESERVLANLKNEQEQLQPIVESNRDAVTAILQAQAKAQRADVWWERGYGFLIGIISSLIASFIFAIAWSMRKGKPAAELPEG